MNTLVWGCQVFLAFIFLYSGFHKSYYPAEVLVAKGQTGVEGLPLPLIRFIGFVEIAGAAGVILPVWLHIAPLLTVITAIGFAVIMLLAMRIHYRRLEIKAVILNITVFCISVFVAFYRWS